VRRRRAGYLYRVSFHTAAHHCTGTAIARIRAKAEKSKVENWPRRIREVLGSVLALIALIGLLVSVDGWAREGFGRVASDVSHARWSALLAPITSVVVGMSADPRFENMFLISLVGAAAVLTVLMLRT
jgi:hypothetical protein